MSLYPLTVISLDAMGEMASLDPGSMICIPITIASGKGLMLAMSQLSETQDYSIRVWMSAHNNGPFLPKYNSYWHLNRSPDQLLVFYDETGTPPVAANILAIPLPVDDYVLNILNLVNSENVFTLSSSVVDC